MPVKTKDGPRSAPRRDASRPVDRGPLEIYIGHALQRARATVSAEIGQQLRRHGLSGGEFGVLVVIRYNPGLRFIDVTRALGFRETNFAPLIRGLEQRGWVARRASPADKRTQTLALTPAGERVIAAAIDDQNAYEQVLRQRVGRSMAKPLRRALMAIATDSAAGDA